MKNKGFSLVELIVVIAIMAILVGVAVPVYSSYVEKAQTAADTQLLDTLSQALTVACVGEGVDPMTVVAYITVDEEGKVNTNPLLTFENPAPASKDAIATAFATTINNGADAEFNTIANKKIYYSNGKFNPNVSVKNYEYNGKIYTLAIDTADKDAFKGTSFDAMGVGTIMDQMDSVIDFAQGKFANLGGDGLSHLRQDSDFIRFCNQYPEYATADADTKTKIEMLALVQYTALKSADRDADALYDQFVDNPGGYQMGEGGGLDIVANATMYSLGLSYAQTDEGKQIMTENGWDPDTAEGIYNLMQYKPMSEDEWGNPYQDPDAPNAFGEWLKNNEATAKDDIAGFQGAMGMINQNETNFDPDMLLNGGGFGNDNLVGALDGLLGGN